MKLFFSGIGGSGVSAIAGFQSGRGHRVFGSDRCFDREQNQPLRHILERQGITIVPQDGSGIDRSFDRAIFSTAVEATNPDAMQAGALGIPVSTRPDYLAAITREFRTSAVAGTSGKSTTAGMLAFLMNRLGMSPGYIGGGRVKQFRSDDNPGNYFVGSSDLLVIEACESDGSIVNYAASHAIIGNLALDHYEISETARLFERLAEHTSGKVLMNGDDPNLAACRIENPVRYSVHRDSRYQARDIELRAFSTSFAVDRQHFLLNLPGLHNLYNALACIALLAELGIGLDSVAEHLPSFEGIERRFDVHLNDGRWLVVDDYAHNPHKIASLMTTMRSFSDRVCYVFQPHGFGPTRLMKEGYIETFSEQLRPRDRLLLLPVYDAGGTAVRDITSEDIAGPLRQAGHDALSLEARQQVSDATRSCDAVVVFGARDETLSVLAADIAAAMHADQAAPSERRGDF